MAASLGACVQQHECSHRRVALARRDPPSYSKEQTGLVPCGLHEAWRKQSELLESFLLLSQADHSHFLERCLRTDIQGWPLLRRNRVKSRIPALKCKEEEERQEGGAGCVHMRGSF